MRLNADAAVEERRTPCVPPNKPSTTRRREREGQAKRCGGLGRARRTVSGTATSDLVATIRVLSWLLHERLRPGRTSRRSGPKSRRSIAGLDLLVLADAEAEAPRRLRDESPLRSRSARSGEVWPFDRDSSVSLGGIGLSSDYPMKREREMKRERDELNGSLPKQDTAPISSG